MKTSVQTFIKRKCFLNLYIIYIHYSQGGIVQIPFSLEDGKKIGKWHFFIYRKKAQNNGNIAY